METSIYTSIHTGNQVDKAVSAVADLNYQISPQLVSGENIKTIDGETILGYGELKVVKANPINASDSPKLSAIAIHGTSYKIGVSLEEGGTIDGSLIVTGDLTVNGTQHINNVEHLAVQDQMIYTNSGDATLVGNGGLGIKIGGGNVYGIVHSPDDAVKLGLGTVSSDGVFTFKDGEGNPVAIRADSADFVDGDLVKWKADGNKLISGGQLIDNLIGTDGITIDKAADSDKIEISGKNFVEKPKNYNETSYTTDLLVPVQGGQSGNMFQMRVDYHASKTRLVSTSPDGTVRTLDPIDNEDCVNKKYVDDNFVQKRTGNSVIYGQVDNDTPQTYPLTTIDTRLNKNSIPLYNINTANNFGQDPFTKNAVICTGDPLQPYHAANKKYVDDAIRAASTGTYKHIITVTTENMTDPEAHFNIISRNSTAIISPEIMQTYLGDAFYEPAAGVSQDRSAFAIAVTQGGVMTSTGQVISWTYYTISDNVKTI